MSQCPRLAEMGVLHCEQVCGFAVNSLEYSDFLRIDYERPKGSFLPVSRTYEFPRVQKTAKTGGEGKESVVMESSPELRDALAELRELVGARKSQQKSASVRDEIKKLEGEIAMHSARIEELSKELD